MRIAELCRALAAVPEPPAGAAAPVDDELLERSVRYLASDQAARSVERDPYWPKWDSPWWHMLLLHELGEARRIPEAIVARMVDAMNGLPMHTFPVRPEERPTGTDAYRAYACHCALGCLHQVLTGRGVDVSRALPWVEPWFPRYQMTDGGANCDEAAYTCGEVASSMVGTIATLEAMLAHGGEFVDRAAGFLIERRLTEGSPSRHNAEERAAAPDAGVRRRRVDARADDELPAARRGGGGRPSVPVPDPAVDGHAAHAARAVRRRPHHRRVRSSSRQRAGSDRRAPSGSSSSWSRSSSS